MSEENSQYLWDGTGDADAVVTQLENSLRVYRFAATPLQAETISAITLTNCASQILAMACANRRNDRRIRVADLRFERVEIALEREFAVEHRSSAGNSEDKWHSDWLTRRTRGR